MSQESEDALCQIRQKADEAVKLQNAYARFHERAKEAKAAWDAADEELRELCRSWKTSEEVASRPIVKRSELAQEVFAALVSVGHTEAQARAVIEACAAKGPFASANDWLEAIYSSPGIAEAANAAASNGEPTTEDEADLADARRALAEVGENGAVPWEDVKGNLKSRRRRKATTEE